MNKELAVEMFQAIKPELVWLLFYVLVAGFFSLLAKAALDTLVAYRRFKTNDWVNNGTKVRVRGNIGTVTKYNWRWIHVLLEDGSETMLISMKRWEMADWSLIHNGDNPKTRRQGDSK